MSCLIVAVALWWILWKVIPYLWRFTPWQTQARASSLAGFAPCACQSRKSGCGRKRHFATDSGQGRERNGHSDGEELPGSLGSKSRTRIKLPLEQFDDGGDQVAETREERDQKIRDGNYAFVILEEGANYTLGPARLVGTHDGVQGCLALLMRYDLSTSIKRALQVQRQYLAEEAFALKQEQEITRFTACLNKEIRDARNALNDNLELDQSDANVEADTRWLRKDIEVYHVLLKRMENAELSLDSLLKSGADAVRKMHLEVMAHLEDAFIHAKLIGPGSGNVPDIKVYDIDDEYWDAFDFMTDQGRNGDVEGEWDDLDPRDVGRQEQDLGSTRQSKSQNQRQMEDSDPEAQSRRRTQDVEEGGLGRENDDRQEYDPSLADHSAKQNQRQMVD